MAGGLQQMLASVGRARLRRVLDRYERKPPHSPRSELVADFAALPRSDAQLRKGRKVVSRDWAVRGEQEGAFRTVAASARSWAAQRVGTRLKHAVPNPGCSLLS